MTLVAIATAVIATVAVTSAHALRQARDGTAATQRVLAQLERLRAGPLADGAAVDTASTGTTFALAWHTIAGRGRPDRLDVAATWADGATALESQEARP